MHIAHTEASCGWGGQEIRILTESSGMIKNGHRVTILANETAPILAEAERLGIEAVAAPLQKKNFSSIGFMRDWLKKNTPDVVNTHSSVDAWVVAAARIGTRQPIVRTRHISAEVPRNPLSRWLFLKGADRVITTGRALADTLTQQLGGPPGHFRSIPTGIDTKRYSRDAAANRDEARSRFGIPREAIVIGIAATIRTWKGHPYLLEAFNALADRHLTLHLLIAGEGPMLAPLKESIGQSKAKDRIHLAGQLNDVENALAAMDIFALPSYANEGVPQAILQAMSMELPVVSTPVGSIREAVVDGETGFIVEPKNSEQLEVQLNALVSDDVKRAAMATAGRQRILQRFGLEQMVDAMTEVFESVQTR